MRALWMTTWIFLTLALASTREKGIGRETILGLNIRVSVRRDSGCTRDSPPVAHGFGVWTTELSPAIQVFYVVIRAGSSIVKTFLSAWSPMKEY